MTTKITSDNIASATLSTLGGAKITSLTYPSSSTAANPAGGETVTITGSGFSAGATVYVDTTSCATTYVSATSLTFTAPAKSLGSYHLFVYNTDGSSAIKPGGFISSSLPTWVTASGALTGGSQNAVYSSSVSATGDGTITYAVTTGSLPTGLNLNSSTGAITGTPTVVATSTFSITAIDSQNQIVDRSFSIAIASVVSAVEYLVVAGGGGGGGVIGGGAGGGGYRTATGLAVTLGTPYTITVGAGGTGGTNNASGANLGNRGSNSSISGSSMSTLTSAGGGGGGYVSNGSSGGSGAGGGGSSGTFGAGNTPETTPSQGNNGGTGSNSNTMGGGGGGAGAVGGNSAGTTAGAGGIGQQSSISGTATYYAGGGGGGGRADTGYSAGAAGTGGGAAGSTGTSNTGTVNTGGGGGGAGYNGTYNTGGAGGSGVVIIRYADTYNAATSTTNIEAGYPVTSGGYRIYKWITSGTITF